MRFFNKTFFFITILLIALNSFGVCNFTVSNTTVCAGDIITVKLDTPYAKYHNIIVYKGTFPFGSNAVAPNNFQYIGGSVRSDNEIKIAFSGAASAQTFQILLAESNSDLDPNPQTPCGKAITISVNPSPDASFTEPNDFIYCSANTNTNITVTNTSTTQANNTNYTINWGDGQPPFSAASYSTTSHSYAPGSYVLTYTVTGSFALCNKTIRTSTVVIGATAPRFQLASAPTVLCAPAFYSQNIDTSVTNRNTPDTYYKFYVNGELVAQYTQGTLPTVFTQFFTEGSCDANRSECSPDKDFFSVRSVAQNKCGVNPFTNCVAVQDTVAPKIQGKDTACLNVPEKYINIDKKGRIYVFADGRCEKRQTWELIPNTGFTTTTPLYPTVTDEDLNITFTSKGTYRIKLTGLGYCDTMMDFKDVVVVDKVVANDTFPPPACLPAAGFIDVPFTNTSTDMADIRSFQWTVTPSVSASFIVGTPTSKDVTIRFTKSGTYSVGLTITGGCNDDTKTQNVVIKGKGSIDTGAIPPGCSVPYAFNPLPYFNSNNGGDAAATYTWSFPGAVPAASALFDPGVITYNAPGPYTITLKISNICGDSILSKPITVFNNPKPSVGPDLAICKFDPPVRLLGNPGGGVWRGKGITDSINGIFTPSSVPTGTYQLIYVLNPNAGCPTYDTINIKIVEIIGLTAGPDQTICKSTGTLQLISDIAFPNGSWFGTGVINTTQGIFDATGLAAGPYQVGYVYQDSTGACRDTAYKKVLVFDSIHLTVPAPVLCAGLPFNFGAITGNIASATWKFGDGTPDAIVVTPSHTFASPGHYTVTLIAETPDHCKDTLKIPIDVTSNPPLSFIISPDSSCSGNNILFTFPAGHDTATNYFWDFGSATVQSNTPDPQQYSFPKPVLRDTNYIVTLRADYFCGPSFVSDTVKVKANPKADFGVQPTGCSPFTPTLANTSYGSPTSYSWSFGNGQTTTVANPTAPTYVNMTRRDSLFTISLTVSNVCGRDSIRKNITVKGNDVFAKFFPISIQDCQPLTDTFFSISSPGAQLIWDFGDGTTSYADQVVHTYDTAGVFRVKLTALGACGRDSAFGTATVFATPKVSFELRNACVGQPTQFINKTTNGNSNIWYFGDGSQSTSPNPTHIYTAAGAYKVKLIVANSRPCVDSTETTVVVSDPPTAGFTVTNPVVCQEEPTIFLNSSTNATSYLWYFGNGETSNQAVPAYTYPASGIFTVSLVAINGQCRDSIFKPAAAQIYPKPLADFLYNLGQNGFHDPIEFTNITLNGISYFWTFGDGDTSREKDPTHQYNGEGPYRVTLFTVSSHNCMDTISKALGVDYNGVLYVPNVFAPEVGAGESAIFKPKGLSMKEYHIEIFSTYGQLLWESDKLENGQPVEGWDGRYKGTLLPQDVYVWKIRAIFENGKAWEGMKDPKSGKKAIMGSVVLLR